MKCEFTESRKSTNRLCRCASARRHACRLCAATGTVAPPLLDGRESVASVTPRPYVCKHRCERDRKEGKPPAPVRHRSPTRSQPLRGHRHSRTSVYRWPKIGRVAHTNMRATTEGAEILRSGNSLPRRAIALGYSPTECAGSGKHRRPRLSMVENRSCRAPTPIYVHESIGAAEILRSGNSLRRRAIALG